MGHIVPGKIKICPKCRHLAHRNGCPEYAYIPIPEKQLALRTRCPCSPYNTLTMKKNFN